MTMLPLSEAKARLSEIAEEVATTHERVRITKSGREYVVLLAAQHLESLEATLELLADPEAQGRLRVAEAEIAAGDILVPVDFEAGGSWWERVVAAGFDPGKPAVLSSTGVSMYLTEEANEAALREIARLAPHSTLAMTFLLPTDLHEDALRPGFEAAMRGAQAAGTPFISFYRPDDLVQRARQAGFKDARHVSSAMLNERYFSGRHDGLRTYRGEELLVATT